MKELMEKILTYLPRYLMEFGSLVSEPKRFMNDILSGKIPPPAGAKKLVQVLSKY
jgi:hypothetical protein